MTHPSLSTVAIKSPESACGFESACYHFAGWVEQWGIDCFPFVCTVAYLAPVFVEVCFDLKAVDGCAEVAFLFLSPALFAALFC